MNKTLRNSLILTGVILSFSILLYAVMTVFQQIRAFETEPRSFEILVKGEVFGQYDLSENQEIPVEGYGVICVSDGRVSVISADCPHQSCVHHAPISQAGECIVCLPNQVIVRILGSGSLDFVL